jgi:hypothetical protein
MPSSNRVYWAVKAIGLAPYGSAGYTDVRGAQAVGINTNFNLDSIFELGQSSIYELAEQLPDIEVTISKVLDGYPLIYHLATRGYTTNTLQGRINQRCNGALSVFLDTQDSASGVPQYQVDLSGLYVSSIGYQFPVDGNMTESITLVGNNIINRMGGFTYLPNFLNTETPITASGGVQQRADFIWDGTAAPVDVNGQAAVTNASIFPPEIAGISSSGTNNADPLGNRGASVQSVNISCDLGREAIYELGHKGPYYRFATFPVEVTTEIEIISKSGSNISATEFGVLTGVNAGSNLQNRTIRVVTREGTNIYLGTANKLASVNMGGADAGGGNETVTYRYSTYNFLTVTHPRDPA